MSDTHPDNTGMLLASRYRLAAVLGQGGMGTVWRAVDEFLGRDVAVKELRFAAGVDDDEQHRLVARTLTEAKAIARIRHNGAVTVYDVVEEDGRPWIVMELVESRSLSEVIRTDGVLPPQRAAEVALELLGVLAEAHRVGILHRDVKPSNVLIGYDGRVVLTDFGIARVEGDPSVTSTGMLVGAPSYISPERARGHVPGPPADMWSLGATLYAMVEGVPPYDKGSALSTLTAVITEPVPTLSGDKLLQPVVAGLLHKDPAQRLDASTTRRMLGGVIGEYERRARATAHLGSVAEAPTQSVPAPDPTRVQPLPTVPSVPTRPTAPMDSAAPTVTHQYDHTATEGRSGHAGRSGRPASSGRSRRPLFVAAIVVAAVLLVTAAVAALHHDSGTGSGSAAGSGGGASSQDGASSSPRAGTDAPSTDRNPAAGFHTVTGPGGSTIAIPIGWRETARTATRVSWTGAAGTLVVDFTPHPAKSGALKAWQNEEPRVAAGLTDYHLVRLGAVPYRGWDAADWEWTFRAGLVQRHSLNRGFVVDASHGYAIYWTASEAAWQGARNATLIDDFFKSFQPAGG
ncbi:serine/threonine-protein kinase [Streptacidiphilus jiangxiensis]|uniref:non-specific serine/threonine protein kinase n=1 Tax=Streptacidiphilus jiangxiensis TaxID=235985 RepID=A0A1H7M8M5_STRJI|nr:serine/threonine-protein kinase [Streptacidiphilus jiangxiensis]SEL07680.1 Serine/threonine protein kinase [Streptacidiphilus jiangxiensis]